jgi:haloacetate dehalogenase
MEDYVRCFSDPRTIAGSCADYRSAASIDLVHDDETFAAGRKLECPVLVLWGTQGFVGRGYQSLSVWQEYAIDVRGQALPTGHFLPEEAPDLVTAALRDFLLRLPSGAWTPSTSRTMTPATAPSWCSSTVIPS